jgi:ABC-type multidrug transport system fused ATPase/permease subunit
MTEVTWQDFPGRLVLVRAPAGSFAAGRAPDVLREAERVAGALGELLRPDTAARAELYLVDRVPGAPPVAPAGAQAAVLEIASGEPPPPVAWALTRVLLAGWFGPNAVATDAVVDGIAGVAAARAGTGPSVGEADEWVREAMGSGRPVSVVGGRSGGSAEGPPPGFEGGPPPGMGGPPGMAGGPPPGMGGAPPGFEGGPPPGVGAPLGGPPVSEEDAARLAATSFASYLIQTFGGEALRMFLESYDPERRDQAATAAFQQPLGGLEEAWLKSLMQGGVGGTMSSFARYVLPHFKPYWWRQAEVLVYMVVGSLLAVVAMPVAIGAAVGALGGEAGQPMESTGLLARIIGNVQDWLAADPDTRLWVFMAGLLVIYTFDALITMRRAVVSETITQRLLMDLQERMFDHLQRLPHSFYSHANVGDVMARLSGDIQMVSMTMTEVLNQGLYLVISFITAGLAVVTLNLWLGSTVLVVVPIFIVTYKVLGARLARASYERGNRAGEAANLTQENLSAHAVVKAFGLEGRAKGSYHARLVGVLKSALRMVRISALFDAATSVAITIGQLIVLGFGGWLVLNDKMELGILVAFLGLLPSLLQPIAQFSGIGETVQQTAGSLARVSELLDVPITVEDKPGAGALQSIGREIRLDHVTFSYEGGRPILEDFELVIPAGTSAAIVGPSGSGKSTVVNLLLRFWDPQEGRVLFDGTDIREVTLASLRSQIGLVFQDTFVFNTTVRENIAIGRLDAADEEIVAAARGARLSEYVDSLPSGYDSVLGERGLRMSGGQRQRLAIARVLLRDPRIMVLDEATSALDAETEAGILETLDEVVKGRTTVAITHRLSLAAKADLIFVIDKGRLIEKGTHAELSTAGGLYQRLYEAQSRYSAAPVESAEAEIARLRSVPLFAELPEDALAAIAAQTRPEVAEPGQDVVRQGETGDRAFVVDDGRLEVVVASARGERHVSDLGPGDVFGEMALLDGGPRNATVRAETACRLFALTTSDLAALLERHPSIRTEIERIVEARESALQAAVASAG